MKTSDLVIDVMPIEHERLSASEFSKLVSQSPASIKSSTFIPGALGSKSFGKFEVTYSRPIYRKCHGF
jgi:hypothetical protein